MRRMIADLYRMMYNLTNNKLISLLFALLYITALNLLTIYGFGLLVEDWLPTSYVHTLFAYPFIVPIAIVAFVFNFVIMLPLQNLSMGKKTKPMIWSIIAYTAVSILLFLYVKYLYVPSSEQY